MSRLFAFLVILLAGRRLTRLVIDDKITEPVRDQIWKTFPSESPAGYFISCRKCVSIWTAFTAVSLYRLGKYGILTADVLAISEASIMVDDVLESKKSSEFFN